MRGQNEGQQAVFTLLTPDQAVPLDHPARRIKALADEQLKELSPLFDQMYSKFVSDDMSARRSAKAIRLFAETIGGREHVHDRR